MAQLGANVEELDNLGRRFDEEASKIEGIMQTITGQVDAVWWMGADADRFRNEWQTTHRTSLRNICQSLSDAANRCRSQAEQQRQTSGA